MGMYTETPERPEPFDPMCQRFAKDMSEYDFYIMEDEKSPPPTPEQREDYVRNEEGTYNRENGHFLCDMCYIKAGMPSSPSGWKCP
jgi:hypothetical protein